MTPPRFLLAALAVFAPLLLTACYGESYCPVAAAAGADSCDYAYYACDVADAPSADHDVRCEASNGSYSCMCHLNGEIAGFCDTNDICDATLPDFDYQAMTDAVNECCGWEIDGSVFD